MRILGGLTQFQALLSIADYRWYALGNFCSMTGLWIQRVAIGWLVWELSHSAVWLGVVGFSTVVVAISSQTLIQSSIRTRYRGRVMSTYGMIAQGVPSIGAFLMGLALIAFGLGVPVLVGALVCPRRAACWPGPPAGI